MLSLGTMYLLYLDDQDKTFLFRSEDDTFIVNCRQQGPTIIFQNFS